MRALINCEIAKEFETKTGIKTVPLPAYQKLDLPVASHADMLFCILNDTVFCYEDYVKLSGIYEILKKSGYKVVFASAQCEKTYPKDISLNILVMGKTVFCNEKYASKEVLEYANEHNFVIKNVKQGYAACSTLIIDENNAITSDISVFNAIKESGKNVLMIDNSGICLKGYNCGFIGGSTGVFNNKIFVFGQLEELSDWRKIKSFIDEINYEIIPILHGGVCDFGGIKFI